MNGRVQYMNQAKQLNIQNFQRLGECECEYLFLACSCEMTTSKFFSKSLWRQQRKKSAKHAGCKHLIMRTILVGDNITLEEKKISSKFNKLLLVF
jgi:hypothetical protein